MAGWCEGGIEYGEVDVDVAGVRGVVAAVGQHNSHKMHVLGLQFHIRQRSTRANAGYLQKLVTCKSWIRAKAGYVQKLDTCKSWISAKAGYVQNLDTFKIWVRAKSGYVQRLDQHVFR